MDIRLNEQLVLQTAGPTLSAYSPSFQISPDNAFEAAAVVMVITGSNGKLCIAAEITNDDENWLDLADLCGITAIGLVTAPVYGLANARCRLRYDFGADSPGGTCILASSIRTTRL